MELRKISKEELEKVLELHKLWLNDERVGKRADLSYTDLKGVDLSDINLSHANLSHANLSHANLRYVNLKDANLSNAILIDTNLTRANLTYTCLTDANLSDADLKETNLSYANLSNANLSDAYLNHAILTGVRTNHLTLFFSLQCPEEGSFIGYKKVKNKIVKLLIPEDAKRSSATSRKCRCSKAVVLSITSLDGKESFDEVINTNYNKTIYKVDEAVFPDRFDENRWDECSNGIHFFITRDEAVNY